MTTGKLWTSAALSPYGNEYGSVAVVAETLEEAIAKAGAKLELELAGANYVPHQRYLEALLDDLEATISVVADDVQIAWDAVRKR